MSTLLAFLAGICWAAGYAVRPDGGLLIFLAIILTATAVLEWAKLEGE